MQEQLETDFRREVLRVLNDMVKQYKAN